MKYWIISYSRLSSLFLYLHHHYAHTISYGSIILSTQADVYAFAASGSDTDNGDSVINGGDITNLNRLYNLRSITKDFDHYGGPNLLNFEGLNNLSVVSGLGNLSLSTISHSFIHLKCKKHEKIYLYF